LPAHRIAQGAAALCLLVSLGAPGVGAEEVYRYVDAQGVVHLSNVPADRRFAKYEVGSDGGTGHGMLILAHSCLMHRSRREIGSVHIPGEARPPASPAFYDQLIAKEARRHGLPPALVKAVVKAESNFQPDAISTKGAQGLMQLMPETAEELGVDDPFRAEDNVQAGTRYLRQMIDRFGDWQHALAAYNAGPGAVDRWGGIPPFGETQQYVERVLHYYRRYDGDFSR
jgi:hypothetical protein